MRAVYHTALSLVYRVRVELVYSLQQLPPLDHIPHRKITRPILHPEPHPSIFGTSPLTDILHVLKQTTLIEGLTLLRSLRGVQNGHRRLTSQPCWQSIRPRQHSPSTPCPYDTAQRRQSSFQSLSQVVTHPPLRQAWAEGLPSSCVVAREAR